MAWWKILLIIIGVAITMAIGIAVYVLNIADLDPYVPMFAEHCSSCHGAELEGTTEAIALIEGSLKGGDSVVALAQSIRQAHPQLGQPAFSAQLTDVDVKGLAIYIAERRLGQHFTEFRFDRVLDVPNSVQKSESHDFVIEKVVDGLDPLIFSIEPMPDGAILVSEKERGLSIVSPQGVQSELIVGTPRTGGSIDVMGIQYGSGWMLDVALHPNYANNGWVYLHYTDLCEECGSPIMEASMNRVDRGRIVDGQWVDVETIWQAPKDFYQSTPDTGAGGRLAFDNAGHVYISMGLKSSEEGGMGDMSAQALTNPYGKIHRVRDDGSIPLDNPFYVEGGQSGEAADRVRQSIWTYGHRSPQGLEWHPIRERAWNSEMGPRGGDELNELIAGRNYGWPFHSLGLEYAGIEVQRYKQKGLEFDESEVEQTLVDITPSPAISSFAFYMADAFPEWHGNVLIGSLKGMSLFRMVFQDDTLVHKETVIKDLARIRDVEVGFDGLVYLLLETEAGSSIVRLKPA